jgi:hypothetical protein
MAVIHVESVIITPKDPSITIKESGETTLTFTVTIIPENATNKDLLFSINDTSLGSIDENGVFTARNCGAGTITVTSVDGGKTDSTTISIYKKWPKPEPPILTYVTKTTADVACDYITVFSLDGGTVWEKGPAIINLKPKTNYNIICKTLADGYYLESDPSCPSSFMTPDVTPDPKVPGPNFITLAAHNLSFDLNKNIYNTLTYGVTPKSTNNQLFWYSEDDRIISVNGNGDLLAVGIGATKVYAKSIFTNNIFDYCDCIVYKTTDKPNPPVVSNVSLNSIELKSEDRCEYSMDKIDWQDSPLFTGLTKNTYYSFYQRIKSMNEYLPPSEPSYGLTIKTLNDETPGGESESGYTWGQEVEVDNINVYGSPFALKPDLKVSGTYYIFNLVESNHRIRIIKNKDYIGVNGHSTGWVNIADLKLIENIIYVGDKVVVDGNINIYSDGSGTSIFKDKQTMYITDIIDGQDYPYGVTTKPGMARQGFAKSSDVTKYKIINI